MVAVATNMMALIFMSLGGSLPFARNGVIERRLLPVSIVLTLVGSALGALLLLRIPVRALQLTIAIAMIAVAVLSLAKKDSGTSQHSVSSGRRAVGYVATFFLAVYGGFFSGGYVTMLTAVFVLLFGLTFLQSVATTKVINVFSSAIATLIFVWDYKLGVILGVTMFLGAIIGGQITMRLNPVWLRRIFCFCRRGACREDGLYVITAVIVVWVGALLRKEYILSLGKLHGATALFIVVPYVIDSRIYGIAPHQPSMVRLQQLGRCGTIVHARIEPQIIAVLVEDDGHTVVDWCGHSIRHCGQDQAGFDPIVVCVFPAIP
jgi:uncharacterized membrane protein YfcA